MVFTLKYTQKLAEFRYGHYNERQNYEVGVVNNTLKCVEFKNLPKLTYDEIKSKSVSEHSCYYLVRKPYNESLTLLKHI
jgi:hypothetical protein